MAAAQRSGPTRPMRADARRNSELLIRTAREVFAEKGAEAPLDEIAKRAGVGAGTLYRHFPNRDALIEAVYVDEMTLLSRRADELLAQHTPADALKQWVREQVNWVNKRRGLSTSLKAAMKPDSEKMLLCRQLIVGAADKLLVAGRAAGTMRSDLQPYDLVRLCHGLAIACEYGTEADHERMIDVVVGGLRP